MTKKDYMDIVGNVFDTLAKAILDFKAGKLTDLEMAQIIRKAYDDTPKGWLLIDEDLAECLELDEALIGQVIPDPYWDVNYEHSRKMVDEIIADIPNWHRHDSGRLSFTGSNSFIVQIIGEAEWHHFRYRYLEDGWRKFL